MEEQTGPGLDNVPRSEWPKPPSKADAAPIDLLADQTLHNRVRDYLVKRLDYSENAMKNFYNRWNIAENKIQAYINLGDFEKTLKELQNDRGAPPKAVSIIVPYTYATVATIVTYLLQAFAGRRPLFQLNAYRSNAQETARKMEMVLQYNADHSRFVRHLYTFLTDGQTYGVSIFKTRWEKEMKLRTRYKEGIRTRSVETVYQGNAVESIDPFMFFPDPRVPMTEVNKRGEFVFWRRFVGKHILAQLQGEGTYKYINKAVAVLPDTASQSNRGRVAQGDAQAGLHSGRESGAEDYYQEDQGTIMIVPRELGLGESEKPERWLFTMLNKQQIVQAEPFIHDHDMHPVAVSEPYTLGYSFGQISMVDMLGPLQDLISWFFNSHVDNVRRALNDTLIVDPLRVELMDVKSPGPGKIIRLKTPIIGGTMDSVIKQLPIVDVTASHIPDAQQIMRIGQIMSAVTDNVMGIQQAGGRKTATEVRTAAELGASRLAAIARLISSQALIDVTEQMVINIQQFMEEDFYYNVMGPEGMAEPIHIQPDQLVGDFNFPVHDGTIPLDRIALLDVWKEIFQATAQDPELAGRYDRGKMFEFMAELGGVRNLDAMKRPPQLMPQVMPDGAAQAMGAKPGMVPIGGPGTGPSALVQALAGPPPRAQGVLPQ